MQGGSTRSAWAGILLAIAATACASTSGRDLVVRDVREGTILVEIPMERIERVAHGAGETGSGRDLIYIEGREEPLRGAVLEQSREALLVELGEVWAPDSQRRLEDSHTADLDRLKEEVQRELLEVGSLEGRILEKGAPLEGCRVKAVRLSPASVLGLLSTWQPGRESVTVTGEDGRYRFEELPAGAYKIFWWPPWEDGWIRRIPWEPDVRVQRGRTATATPVESRRRVLR